MTLAFTLCSNNYLAQAKVLGDNFLRYHANAKFVIGLVDEFHSDIDYSLFQAFTLIPVSELCIAELSNMDRKYNIVELNTAVKPFYFSYLFEKMNANKIIYLDPDIQVFSTFCELLSTLDRFNIVLTPQNCIPIDDGEAPSDINLLGTGVFNLGFIALSNFEKVKSFLSWWTSRLIKYSFNNIQNQMFYDQIWINLVPAFFDNYFVLKHPGYNMSPSNLHERKLSKVNGMWIINGLLPLRFYHFSGFQFFQPDKICSYSQRFTFESRADIIPLYKSYRVSLEQNHIGVLSDVKPYYCTPTLLRVLEENQSSKLRRAANRFSRALKVLIGKA